MQILARTKILVVIVLGLFSFAHSHTKMTGSYGDFEYVFSGMFKPEMFYGKNISLLNNNNKWDKVWFMRHTLDMSLGIGYGKETYNKKVVDFFFTLRNRGIWGNPTTIAFTADAELRLLDAVGQSHKHGFPRHIFWMREGWINFSINDFLGLALEYPHTFKLGSFSFQLGRGIALGDAYAVGPEFLGFYSDSLVDQYAFGGLLSGTFVPNTVTYDLYAAILQNLSSTLADTGARVLGQEFGKIANPARGYGKINYVIAGRIGYDAFNNERYGKLHMEPYAMYNSDPEQMVDFRADASSKLGTIGFATEYFGTAFEFGFDGGCNLGKQFVKGWDFNQITEENRDGFVVLSNSQVNDKAGKRALFIKSSNPAQVAINNSAQGEEYNGKPINSLNQNVIDVGLVNSATRYRNPYNNKYQGWFFVADAATYVYKKDVKLCAEGGIASGDDDPNFDTKDSIFDGFIPLQSAYTGNRVRSAFLLGGAGKLKRELSVPLSTIPSPEEFGSTTTEFSNIIYGGIGIRWEPQECIRKFRLNPNILVYWQDQATRKFDVRTRRNLEARSNRFLGAEVNVFFDYYIFREMKVFFVGSLFVPGAHYRDVRGRPLSPSQVALLNVLDTTGFDDELIPNLGTDPGYTLNLGIEYRF
jgi:hypothetical protein